MMRLAAASGLTNDNFVLQHANYRKEGADSKTQFPPSSTYYWHHEPLSVTYMDTQAGAW